MINSKKKFIFVAMLVFLCSFIVLLPNYNNTFIAYVVPNSQVSFYTTQKLNKVPDYLSQTDIGMGSIIECPSSIANSVAKTLKNIAGISFCFDGTKNDINEFLDKVDAVILKIENIDSNIKTYLCYSPKLRNNINIDNLTINFQIAQVNNKITIGSPIILGEY